MIAENAVNANPVTLSDMKNIRYMDVLLLASNSFADLETIADEEIKLFESRDFKLRKWVANSQAKLILLRIPRSDLASNFSEIDARSQPIPDSKALLLTWDTEDDVLRGHCREFAEASTKHEISSQLTNQFDPSGMASPFLLGRKLI